MDVPTFRDSADLYEVVGPVLVEIVESASLAAELSELDASVSFLMTEPEAALLLDLRAGSPHRVTLGAASGEIAVKLSGAILNGFLIGALNPFRALQDGSAATSGMNGEDTFALLAGLIKLRIAPLYVARLFELDREEMLQGLRVRISSNEEEVTLAKSQPSGH